MLMTLICIQTRRYKTCTYINEIFSKPTLNIIYIIYIYIYIICIYETYISKHISRHIFTINIYDHTMLTYFINIKIYIAISRYI